MQFKPQVSLATLTTFRIGGPCLFYAQVSTETELKEALAFARSKKLPILVIGGGSNLLVSDKGFEGLVIQIAIKGREIISESGDEIVLKIGAGEGWDDVVAWSVEKHLWGIENLSNIPGFTGAIPVQNVGAYGQEASQSIENVEALDLQTLEKKVFSNQECGFGYRRSNFNSIWKNKFVILSVTFKLSKSPQPNLDYMDVKKYFADKPNPTQPEIRNAIIEIRKNKFPDLNEFGTAGSFFKNLILTEDQYNTLVYCTKENFGSDAQAKLEAIKNKFPQKNGIKIPTAYLIELCGLKGKTSGNARLWEKQALVIVNQGDAKASDVLELFETVRKIVKQKTGMELQAEPEFIGF